MTHQEIIAMAYGVELPEDLEAHIEVMSTAQLRAFIRAYGDRRAAAEREALQELLRKAREVAEWHVCRGDDCGTLARIVMADIDSIRARGQQ